MNVIALEVELEDDEDDDEDVGGYTFGGAITSITPTTVSLSSGIVFMIDEDTVILGNPQIGDHAKVTFQISFGRLLTKKIVVVASSE